MRLAAALATGLFVYLFAGHLTGNAPRFSMTRVKKASKQKLWLTQAGLDLSPKQFWAGSTVVGVMTFGLAWVLTGAWAVALVPSITVALLPRAYFSRARARRLSETIQAWPDGLRDIAASIAVGRSISQAIEALALTGPEPLRSAFERFPTTAQMFGVPAALTIVKEDLADATSDRVIEVLLVAYERGGPSVNLILGELTEAVTQDLRVIDEIRTAELEQKINARAVFALPWLVLFLITVRNGPFREFYQSPIGVATVIAGGILSLAGIWMVSRLGRDPAEPRVFASAPRR